MSVGERIAELRKKENLSQGQLASLLDVSRQAVSKWENDLSAPDTLKLIQLADVLKTDVEYLSTGRINNQRIEHVIVKVPEIREKIIEKPVVKYIEKTVEKPVVRYVEKPIIKKVVRFRYFRNPIEYFGLAIISFLIGVLVGNL